jgi:Ca2+-binding RTX toxin-like protein
LATAATDLIDGFETIRVTDTLAADITVANIQDGISKLRLDDPGTARTVTMEAGAREVELRGAVTTSLTINDTGTATDDTLTITNKAAATDLFGGAASLSVNGYETVSFSSSGTGAAASQDFTTITLAADTGGTTALNLSGSNAVSTTGSITAGTIDASGLTAQAAGTATFTMGAAATSVTTITGSAGDDTLIGDTSSTIDGGAGADTITGGTGNDTLTGGDGNDTITTDTGNDTVVAGAGDDIVVLSDGDATALDVVNGGDGTDTLVMTEAVTADEMVGYTGFEKLRFDETVSQDMALIPGTNVFTTVIHSDAAAALTLTNAGASITTLNLLDDAGAGTTSDISFDRLVDTSTNSITILGNQTADTDVDEVTVNDEETITITSGNATTETVTIDDLNASDATSLTLTGTAAITITNAIVGATNLATVDASSMSAAVDVDTSASAVVVTMTGGKGGDTLEGGIRADTINGGDGGDTLIGNQGADTLNGGAGTDNLTGNAGADTYTGGAGADDFTILEDSTGITVATADTITDFVTGTDTISLNQDGTGALNAVIADGTSIADFTALVTAVDAVFTAGDGANDNTAIYYNALGTGDAYVFVDSDDSGSFAAGDDLIILSGINLSTEVAITDFNDL